MKATKIAGIMLSAMMSLSVLAGCGSTQETEQNVNENAQASSTGAAEETEQTQTDDGEWTGDVSHVVMVFLTTGVEPADLGKVQDAVNEISIPKIGVEVEFKPVSIFNAPSQVPMWIGAGEQIDVLPLAFTGIQPFIDQGMLEPMDEWIASQAPYIQSLSDEYPVFDTSPSEGIYGIMTLPSPWQRAGGYLIRVADLEEAGLSYEDGQLVTLDEMDDIFAAIKAAKPDVYPCGITGAVSRANMTYEFDTLGATMASGALIGIDSTEVQNVFASEEYKNYLNHVRSWYENGYVMKDAATTDISLLELAMNGGISGYFSEGNAALRAALELQTGEKWIHLLFNQPYIPAISAASQVYWTVPVTAAEPEAAVRFVNLMFEDPSLSNTLTWGVKDVHWQFSDEDLGVIDYAEGLDASTSGYQYGLGLFGQQKDIYSMGDSTKLEDEAWDEIALSRKTKGYGFCYDASAMTSQITAIEAVITEYQAALDTGSADLETTYPEFIKKLEANGINDVIADKQAQFDSWRSKK